MSSVELIRSTLDAREVASRMRDDPKKIADWLERKHGLEAAQKIVFDGLMKALAKPDFYDVSVWREVRRILAARKGD